MKILTGKRKKLEEKGAEIISKKIREILKNKKNIILAVPGGKSISGILKNLNKKNLPWEKIQIFLVDERIVPLNNKNSNYKLIKNILTKIPKKNIHSINYEKKNPEKEYELKLKKYSNSFDIVLLSSGKDCHIASLFPNHHTIKNPSDFFIKTESSPKPPKKRITASKKLIEKSKTAILLFFGKEKQKAYTKFLDKKLSVKECPAKIVKKIKDSYVLRDLK